MTTHKKQETSPYQVPKYLHWYDVHYKKLMIIPFILLLLALAQIGYQYATTGDFINKGISLKGGVSVVVSADPAVTLPEIEQRLAEQVPGHEIAVRELRTEGQREAIIIESDITSDEDRAILLEAIRGLYETPLRDDQISTEVTGSALGENFFRQVGLAMVFAFVFMSIVIFIIFRSTIPSLAVIICAFTDIVVTIAVINVMGVRVSTAGVAALLMLIGYSVDSDILLTNRVLKRRDGVVIQRVIGAAKTGLLMTFTTLAAVSVGLLVTQSEVISQIMLIIFIGLWIDLLCTWFQNAGLIRLYLERKGERK